MTAAEQVDARLARVAELADRLEVEPAPRADLAQGFRDIAALLREPPGDDTRIAELEAQLLELRDDVAFLARLLRPDTNRTFGDLHRLRALGERAVVPA